MGSEKAYVPYNNRSIETDFRQPLPVVGNQRTSHETVHVIEDDEHFEQDARPQHDHISAFQFAPVHLSARYRPSKTAESSAHEPASKQIHRLASDDDLEQACYAVFPARPSNIGLSRKTPDSNSQAEKTSHGDGSHHTTTSADHRTDGDTDMHPPERLEHLDSEYNPEDAVDPTPGAQSVAGTTQFDHSTPSANAEYPTPFTTTMRRDSGQLSRPESAPPLSNRTSRASSEISATPRTHPVLKPQNDKDRVKKVTQQVRRSPSPDLSDGSTRFPAGDDVENVEDALLYLIGRNRRQAESDKRLMAICRGLETEKQALQDHNNAQQQELVNVQQQWQTAVQKSHIQDAEVRNLKSRYENLKKAMQAFAKTSEDLKQDRDKLSAEHTSLKALGSSATEINRDLRQHCTNTSDRLVRVTNEISALRTELDSLQKVKSELLEAEKALRDEKLNKKKLELYIQRLEGIQRTWHTRSDAQQTTIASGLTKVLDLVKSQSLAEPVDKHLEPVLAGIGKIQQLMESMPGAEVIENLSSTALLRHGEIKETLKQVQGSVDDQYAAADLQLSNIINSLSNIEPDLAHSHRLEAENAGLVQEVLRKNQSNTELRKAHISSQLLCTGLLESQKQLLSQEQVSGSIGETMRELTKSKIEAVNMLESKERENDSLRTTLKQAMDNLAQSKQETKDLQNQSHLNLENLKKDCDIKVKQAQDITQREIQKLDAKIAEERQLHEKEKNAKESVETKLRSSREAAESALRQVQDHSIRLAQQDKEIERLNEGLAIEQHAKREQAEKLQRLQQDNQAATSSNKVLEADIQGKSNRVQRLERDILSKNSEVSELKQTLQQYETRLSLVKQKTDNLEKGLKEKEKAHAEAISIRNGSLASAIQTGTRLEVDLTKATEQNSEARKLIEQLKTQLQTQEQNIKKQTSEAQERNTLHSKEKADLDQQLQLAHDQNGEVSKNLSEIQERYSKLNDKYNKQVEQIQSLDHEVRNLKGIEDDLNKTKTALLSREAEMAQLRIRSEHLEQDLKRFAPMRRYITDADIDRMTEPIILSLKSQIAASQTQDMSQNLGGRHSHKQNPKSQVSQGRVIPDSQSQGVLLRDSTQAFIDHSVDILPDIDLSAQASSAHLHPIGDTSRRQEQVFRPGTSNDEMLLRSPDSPDELLQHVSHQTSIQVPASTYSPSPMKTRNGSQIRHIVPETQIDPNRQRVGTPSSQQRDNHPPNSAVKRQNTAEENGLLGKRPRLEQSSLTNSGIGSSTNLTTVTPKQIRFADRTTVYSATGATPKSMTIAGSTAPAPGSMRKRTNAPKRGSRNSAYEDRFN